MARTLRWIDGTDQPDLYEAEAFGEGQVLLLSSKARIALEGVVGALRIDSRIIRKVKRENGETLDRALHATSSGITEA